MYLPNEINGGIMLKKTTKAISVLLTTLTLIPVYSLTSITHDTNAATLANLNAASVFVKQHTSETCTLSSNAMMLRRAMMLKGGDWESITEESCRYEFWIEGIGMPYEYSFRGIHVGNEKIYGNSAEKLKNVLKDHPEGVVAYDYDYPHAVLLTDYTNGKFYCADPANNTPSGRIEVSESLVNIYDIEDYWYVTDVLPNPVDTNIINKSTISSDKTVVGKKITITGNTDSGEGDIKYSFYYKSCIDDEWIQISNKSDDKAEFYSNKSGKYDIKVIALDSHGFCSKKFFTIRVNDELKINAKLNKQYAIYGEDVVITSSAKNGTGEYQYEINALKPNGAFVNLRKYNKSTTYTYHPWEIGYYKIIINAKDSMGNIASTTLNLNIKSGSMFNNSIINTETINYGENITIKLAALGGSGNYQYKISAKKPSGREVNLRKYNKSTTYTYHPWEFGTYTIIVSAKDSEGRIVNKEINFTVNLLAINNQSKISKDTIKYGEDIIINGSALGGSGNYQYKYYATKPSGQRVNLRKYNKSTTYSYHPWEYGTYIIEVLVKDSMGSVSTKIFEFTVL